MKFSDLPPGPVPTQVTARHTSHSLREHLNAFLCANNKHGFVIDLPPAESPFMAMLLVWVEQPGASVEEFKRQAQKLKDTTGLGAQRTVKLGNCHQVLAAAFGYQTYAAARAARDHNDWIRNRR